GRGDVALRLGHLLQAARILARVICRDGVGSQRPSAPRAGPAGRSPPTTRGARAASAQATTSVLVALPRLAAITAHRGLIRYYVNICRCENSMSCSCGLRPSSLAMPANTLSARQRIRLARSTALHRRPVRMRHRGESHAIAYRNVTLIRY